MELKFEHRMAAHCENGVMTDMLRFYGLELSEPMAFGLASGLFFTHMPFIKMGGMAVTSFRTFPGVLFKRVCKMLDVKIATRRYLNKQHAMRDLDKVLLSGRPVGCVVGMYYLPYMPIEYRFHFNGHNICIVGKDEQTGEYIVSDPMAMDKVRITHDDLVKVRFAKGGTYPLLGQMYWVKSVPQQLPDLKPLIIKAIKKNCRLMVSQPKWVKIVGVNGIYYLAHRIASWEQKMGKRRAALNLANIIRMLEEIGTGGAGFRFVYAAFLQEAAKVTGIEQLNDFSKRMTQIGDLWREFAYKASRIYKRREGDNYTYADLSHILGKIAVLEDHFFHDLQAVVSAQ